MKLKRADRSDWKRITQKRFAMLQVNNDEFKGYISLFCIDGVREPLWINLADETVCLADKGYMWLQQFPQGTHYVITTVFNEQGVLVRWYIDICKQYYLDEQGTLRYVDLYLDLDISPEGKILLLDVDELDEALRQGVITPLDYELAWREVNSLMTAIEEDMFPLLWLGEAHKEQLLAIV
jgi:predicted RNA-binding protein associated with RNAse of E/G family